MSLVAHTRGETVRASLDSRLVKVAERDRDAWRKENLSTVVLVFVRVVRDPALAWDLAAETMASAALTWSAFSGESRLAWVLEHGRRVLRDAANTGRVAHLERSRNNAGTPRVLAAIEQAQLLDLAQEPLTLDGPAREMAAMLQREAPARELINDIALSPLTIRGTGAAERSDA